MNLIKKTAILSLILLFLGCGAYRAYLGLHGPSIQAYPEIHKGVNKDKECLECHHPKNVKDSGAPSTPHPGFHGCLKCHNDKVKAS